MNMIKTLSGLYNEILVATATHNVFSVQVIISLCYLLALCLSIFRALNDKELLSDFLSIAVVVSKYMLTTLLMEKALIFLAESKRGDLAQNVYLALCGFGVLSVIILYRLHVRFSYKYGELFFTVVRLTLALSVINFIIWVKFVVLDIQEGFAVLHYLYSFTVLYISCVLGVVMLFPKILNTKLGDVLSLRLPRGAL
tara:strand:- start:25597 stop:26187 length:591 start_codon:yes stop_codon:yes gene_type:complete